MSSLLTARGGALGTQYFPSHMCTLTFDLCYFSSWLGQTNVQFSCVSSGHAVAMAPAEMGEQHPFYWRGLRDYILRKPQHEIFPWSWMHCAGPHLNLWRKWSLSEVCESNQWRFLRLNLDGLGFALPRVPSCAHLNKPTGMIVASLFLLQERNYKSGLLCPVHALRIYTATTGCNRRSD